MHVSLCLGKRKKTEGGFSFECLYIGQDGVELEAAAHKAAASGEFVEIGRLINPSTAPMPLDPTPMKFSTPVFPRNGKKEVQIPVRPLSALEKKAQDLQRKPIIVALDKDGKLQKPSVVPTTNAEGLRLDGPTLEEYLIAGYKPENYPMKGFAPRDSAGWTMYQQEQASKKLIEAAGGAVGGSTAPAMPEGFKQQEQQQAPAPASAPEASAPAPQVTPETPAQVAEPIVPAPVAAAPEAAAEQTKVDETPAPAVSAPAATAAKKKNNR